MEIAGSITFSHAVMEADMKGSSLYSYSKETVNEARALKRKIEERVRSVQ